jgi:hypothetical protein
MRARSSSALAETVASVATLGGGSLWWPGAILWSLDSLPLTVHICAVVRTIYLALAGLGVGRGGWIRPRGRRGSGLGKYLLAEQGCG